MAFSPIMERELRRAARDKRTYWLRLLVGGLASLSALWPLLWGESPFGHSGWVVFVILAGAGMAYGLCAGMFVTADALSEERRVGTLELLLSTPVRSYEVVFGRLLATSLLSLFGLLPAFPILGLTMFWGGVTGGEFGRVLVAMTNSLFFSMALGMFVSAGHRDSQKAVLASAALIVFLAVVPIVVYAWAGLPPAGTGPFRLLALSPLSAFYLSFDLNYRTAPGLFWESVVSTHLTGWVALAGASLLVSRSRGRPTLYAAAGQGRLSQPQGAGRRIEQARAAKVTEPNPLIGWERRRSNLARVALVLALVICVGALARTFRGTWLGGAVEEMIMAVFILQTWITIWIGWEATRRLHEARQSGELELLLVTPLTVQQIVHGKLVMLGRRFFWPVILVTFLSELLLFSLLTGPRRRFDESLLWLVTACLLGLMLIESMAMAWVGLWQGVTARRAASAFARTCFLVLVLPWLEFIFVGPFLVFLIAETPDPYLVMITWFACRYFNTFFWTGWAANRCYDGFRERVATWTTP